jgi:hypothetical protein
MSGHLLTGSQTVFEFGFRTMKALSARPPVASGLAVAHGYRL